ncbi:MAG: hypothetical protein E6269_12320, partial [Clostridiales bacterium]|nr:hypothetical protein [Clostridiales bacterium]
MEELIDRVKYIFKVARLQVESVLFNIYITIKLKTKMWVRCVLFICLFPLTAMMIKGNNID